MVQSLTVAILVFGIGYIGSRLVQEYLCEGRDVVGFDNFFASDRPAIAGFAQSPGFIFVDGSITSSKDIDRALDVASPDLESVFILAAQASAHPDAASAEYTEEVNLRGPRLVVEALGRREINIPIVYASSLRVHGSPLPSVVDEDTPYGGFTDLSHLSKCYAEKLLQMYSLRDGVTSRVVRLGLTYGVAPVMKVNRAFMTAPNLFCFQASRGDKLVVRNDDAVGLIHVDDAARSLKFAAESVGDVGHTVFNAPSEVSTVGTVAERVRLIAEGREVAVAIDRPTHDVAGYRDLPKTSSAMTKRGFHCRRALDEGLAETFDHFLVRSM